jgi:HD superfamily phosphohydrolase
MRPPKVNFYDPLYDFVTFEEAAASQRPLSFFYAGFARGDASNYGDSISPHNETKALLPFLSSLEFSRQAFLRQSNLAFLVFPSATHTRLAHAIGSCYLGFLASQKIAVGTLSNGEESSTEYLSHFLEHNGLREEFYLALLLHDIGHFPFSHALESNKDFWQAFGEEIHHENAACELIQGSGNFFSASKRRAKMRGSRKKDFPHLSELFIDNPSIDRDAICYFISGDREKYLAAKVPKEQVKLFVIHELVSGLLDLDRVDHYRRDNYFTGLRSGTSLNFPSLLSGMTIYYDPAVSNQRSAKSVIPAREIELRLSQSAIGPAISLLQTKERLTEDCFENPDCIAYEVMLHHAFNMYVYGEDFYEADEHDSVNRAFVYDLLFSTDEQLLHTIGQDGPPRVAEIVFRIMNKVPYRAVTKFRFSAEHKCTLGSIRESISKRVGLKRSDIVLRASKKFGKRDLSKRSNEWLDLARLRHEDGKPLENGKYRRQMQHFKDIQDDTSDFVWLYTTDDKKAERIKRAIHRICDEDLNCDQEDM